MMPLSRLRIALARVRHVHRAAPRSAATGGDASGPVDGDGFAPWGGGDDAAPRERKADGAPEVQGADFEAGGAPPKSTVEKARAALCCFRVRFCKIGKTLQLMRPTARRQARDIGGGLAGVKAASHEAGSRALETGEDAEREALRKAASEAIQQGELARCVLRPQHCVWVSGSACVGSVGVSVSRRAWL
jgi:hypothetical protein